MGKLKLYCTSDKSVSWTNFKELCLSIPKIHYQIASLVAISLLWVMTEFVLTVQDVKLTSATLDTTVVFIISDGMSRQIPGLLHTKSFEYGYINLKFHCTSFKS